MSILNFSMGKRKVNKISFLFYPFINSFDFFEYFFIIPSFAAVISILVQIIGSSNNRTKEGKFKNPAPNRLGVCRGILIISILHLFPYLPEAGMQAPASRENLNPVFLNLWS